MTQCYFNSMAYHLGRLHHAQKEIERLYANHLANPIRTPQQKVMNAINREEKLYTNFRLKFHFIPAHNIYAKLNKLNQPANQPRTPPRRRR
jgi:cytochrome oxidase assembly protein ShyY1